MSIKFYGGKFEGCKTALSFSEKMQIKCNKCGYKENLSKGDHNFNSVKCPRCDSDSVTISSEDDSSDIVTGKQIGRAHV